MDPTLEVLADFRGRPRRGRGICDEASVSVVVMEAACGRAGRRGALGDFADGSLAIEGLAVRLGGGLAKVG